MVIDDSLSNVFYCFDIDMLDSSDVDGIDVNDLNEVIVDSHYFELNPSPVIAEFRYEITFNSYPQLTNSL